MEHFEIKTDDGGIYARCINDDGILELSIPLETKSGDSAVVTVRLDQLTSTVFLSQREEHPELFDVVMQFYCCATQGLNQATVLGALGHFSGKKELPERVLEALRIAEGES